MEFRVSLMCVGVFAAAMVLAHILTSAIHPLDGIRLFDSCPGIWPTRMAQVEMAMYDRCLLSSHLDRSFLWLSLIVLLLCDVVNYLGGYRHGLPCAASIYFVAFEATWTPDK